MLSQYPPDGLGDSQKPGSVAREHELPAEGTGTDEQVSWLHIGIGGLVGLTGLFVLVLMVDFVFLPPDNWYAYSLGLNHDVLKTVGTVIGTYEAHDEDESFTAAVVRFADKDGREWEVDMACPSNYTGASCMAWTVPVVYPRKAPNEAGPEVSARDQVVNLIELMVGLVVIAGGGAVALWLAVDGTRRRLRADPNRGVRSRAR